MSIKLDICFTVDDSSWDCFIKKNTSLIADISNCVFDKTNIKISSDNESIIDYHFVSNSHIRELNKKWRGVDKYTNVLSFPNISPEEIKDNTYLKYPQIHFGDIVIAYEYCKNEADNANITFEEHIFHMVVHGLLHILGYDHVMSNDAQEMEKIEIDILKSFGFSSPY